MIYGILGDIHGNLSALEAVLGCFSAEGVGVVLSVGDVVGYGAAPAECIATLRDRGVLVVKGNHDAATVAELELYYFNRHAKEAIRWTAAVLSQDHKQWLKGLPYLLDLEDCSVAHGSYANPEHFEYVNSTLDAGPSLDIMGSSVCFIGHTHVPRSLLRLVDDPHRTAYTAATEIDLADTHRALVNVGSVGQPRDEDPRAAYALFDTALDTVSIRRVEYDITREADRIRAAGLPEALANRLTMGV
ncbi:MAG: metallophosphoesterase family protein [bacterium]